ncbi:hypothetical protein [Alkalimonas sp.]|uniref:hypothetical protein n=1 Tax=Alkalimonas sp. TaxID=1872453 RepID=UPI00263A8375|nr:hypothetical protein [Alkalimonas sp.]MCC5827330.1 hypothetical protein [Alkalimonas sp.]
MKAAAALLANFCLLLLLMSWCNLVDTIGHLLSSRLLILGTILPSLLVMVRKQLTVKPVISTPSQQIIKAKTVCVGCFLILLLLYSHLMAQLGIAPFSSFVFEYLLLLPLLLLLLPKYLLFVSKRQAEPEDEYARLGLCLLRLKHFFLAEHKALLLKSLVKLLFIPIMVGGLFDIAEHLVLFNWSLHPMALVKGLFFFGLAFDLIIASIGYVFASKLLDNDVKSTDATLSGWLVCMICYPPLLIVYQWFAKQTDDFLWHDWLHMDHPLYWFWAFIITLSWLTYWLSTASFGWYFSNLTWRKLIDLGPYKYTKHPAYVAKNIYWWLHTVPFYGVNNHYELLRNLAGLTFVSSIYYLRAKTEERHLMQFPEYQAYAKHIATQGLLARIRKLLLPHKVSQS